MREDKVMCQCCKKMMVPKVITSAPFYFSGIPVGGGRPEGSICPFCQSPKWMITEAQANAGGQANAEFYVMLILLVFVIVAFARFGEAAGLAALLVSAAAFVCRARIMRAAKEAWSDR